MKLFEIGIEMQSSITSNRNSSPSLTESEIAKINTAINKFPINTEFSIAKVSEGQTYFYGVVKKDDGLNVVNNERAVFEIGSISKVLTSTMLAQVNIDDKLKLDDDISKYINCSIYKNAQITFTQLATHSSGLPRLPPGLLWSALFKDRKNPYRYFGDAELIDYVQKKLIQKKIGKFRYSSLGAGLLGHTLCDILGTNYESALQQLVCRPLGLKSTTTDRNLLLESLVKGRDRKGKETPYWDLNALVGAGGIYSNVTDLTKFALANFDEKNEALKLQHKPTLTVDKEVSVGLGWLIINSKNTGGANWFYHNGGTGGFCSEYFMDLKSKTAIILLTNVSGIAFKSAKLPKLAFELMKNAVPKESTKKHQRTAT